jgi:hypothetical protein
MRPPAKNLGIALRANPDLWGRFHGERRDAMDTYIRTLDPADKERADSLRAEILEELANRGYSWLERGVVLGHTASPVKGPDSTHDYDPGHRIGQKMARESTVERRVSNG